MNASKNKTKAMLIATLLLGLGASALADGTTPVQPITQQTPAPQPAAPSITLQGQPAPATARPTPPAPGQAGAPQPRGPRGGHGPLGAGPGGMPSCTPGAGLAVRPVPGGQGDAGRARPTPPVLGSALPRAATAPMPPARGNAQPGMQKAPEDDKMGKDAGPKDKGMGKGDKGAQGEACPPTPKGMAQGAPRPAAAAPGQATSTLTPATRDLGRLDALSAQTSDSRIRGYLNDARTYLQSASKAQQKAGRDLLHAAEALVRGNQAPQR